jgi:hypothetical protein
MIFVFGFKDREKGGRLKGRKGLKRLNRLNRPKRIRDGKRAESIGLTGLTNFEQAITSKEH